MFKYLAVTVVTTARATWHRERATRALLTVESSSEPPALTPGGLQQHAVLGSPRATFATRTRPTRSTVISPVSRSRPSSAIAKPEKLQSRSLRIAATTGALGT